MLHSLVCSVSRDHPNTTFLNAFEGLGGDRLVVNVAKDTSSRAGAFDVLLAIGA